MLLYKGVIVFDQRSTRGVCSLEEAFNSCLRTLYYNNSCLKDPAKDFHSFLDSLEAKIVGVITQEFREHGAIKFNLVLEATYQKSSLDENNMEQVDFQNVAFKTPNYSVFNITDISNIVAHACKVMLRGEAKFEGNSSGWSLLIIDGLLIRISKHTPLRGSSYIKLPTKIALRKAVINPQNEDQQCFKWAMLAKHVQGGHPQRVNAQYWRLEDKYNFTGLSFPTTINQIDIFEKNNPGVSVNVYGVDDDNNIYPRRVVEHMKEDHTDLLLLCQILDKDKDATTPPPQQLPLPPHHHHTTTTTTAATTTTTTSRIPPPLPPPSRTPPMQDTTQQDNAQPSNAADEDDLNVNSHYCYIKNFEKLVRAQLTKHNGPAHFMKTLTKYARDIAEAIDRQAKAMNPLTSLQLAAFNAAQSCEACNKPFTGDKVRDHCHMTGMYRNALCMAAISCDQ
ncbi:hypothetical protein LSTR_LSTR017562 [Laodelphax striatellus]|uniref:Uncharacterized protein n=1 Tax=Laodelphax striatellus TaxID=195883 RepID=A0A482X680_LAOST|nr:hypothetical protein LSTR_LSTR017562 [Laodelphax striatellus]